MLFTVSLILKKSCFFVDQNFLLSVKSFIFKLRLLSLEFLYIIFFASEQRK